jgi:hypothetical protein
MRSRSVVAEAGAHAWELDAVRPDTGRMRRLTRRGARIALALAAIAASAAGAAQASAAAPGWVEAPPHASPRGGVADCLRSGAPGELAALGALNRATIATDLFATAGDRLARSGTMTLGWLTYCPAVASAAGVATLYAAPVYDPATRRWEMRAGEAGTPPAVLATSAEEWIYAPVAAVAPSGFAVVAWYEHRARGDGRAASRLLVATRPAAGAAFGAAQVVATGTTADPYTSPELGVDAIGTATLGWEETVELGGGETLEHVVRVATVRSDGAVGPPLTLRSGISDYDGLTLAVAPDGGALLATPGSRGLELYERRPGTTAFVPIELPGTASTDGHVAVSLAAGGGAVIADRAEPDGLDPLPGPSPVLAWTRPPGGLFSPPQRIAVGRAANGIMSLSQIFSAGAPRRTAPPADSRHQALSTAIGPGGEVLVTWVDAPDAGSADRARVARGTLTGGFPLPSAHVGGACRMANGIVPLRRADDSLAVAWSDNARVRRTNAMWDEVLGGGAIRLATFGAGGAGGAIGADATPPRAAASVLGPRRLRIGQTLRLRVRCGGGPCDVRGVVAAAPARPPEDPADRGRRHQDEEDDQREAEPLTASTTVARGASGVLRFDNQAGYRIGRRAGGPITLRLTTCAAAGPAVERRRLSLSLARTPPRPVPWLRDVRLHRDGSRYRLTWRTAAPATQATFMVLALASDEELAHREIELSGRGRSRFALSFRSPRPVRSVQLSVRTAELGPVDGSIVRPRAAG